jgi:hypothetical protein
VIRSFLLASCALIFSCGQYVSAQTPKAYFDMDPGFFSGGQVLVVNDRELTPGILSPGKFNISELMRENVKAYELAKKHEDYATWSGIALWGGVGGAIAYLATSRDLNHQTYQTYWGIFGVGLIASAALQKASIAYLYKAINAFNGVTNTPTATFGFSIRPLAEGATLGLDFSF